MRMAQPTHSTVHGYSGAERSTDPRRVQIDAQEDGQTEIEFFGQHGSIHSVRVPTAQLLLAVAAQAGRRL